MVATRCLSRRPIHISRLCSSFPLIEAEPKKTVRTTLQELKTDAGKSLFMQKVYAYTGAGMAGSIATAVAADHFGFVASHPMLYAGGLVATFGSIFFVGGGKSEWVARGGKKIKTTIASMRSVGAFATLSAGMGIMITPLVTVCNEIDPTILPTAAGLTMFTFAGCSLIAYTQPPKALLSLGMPLTVALFGFAGMSLLSIVSDAVVGPTAITNIWSNVDMYAGLGLFSLFTMYDTHYALDHYENEENPSHVGCATGLYLDLVNLLIRFMEILAKWKK